MGFRFNLSPNGMVQRGDVVLLKKPLVLQMDTVSCSLVLKKIVVTVVTDEGILGVGES